MRITLLSAVLTLAVVPIAMAQGGEERWDLPSRSAKAPAFMRSAGPNPLALDFGGHLAVQAFQNAAGSDTTRNIPSITATPIGGHRSTGRSCDPLFAAELQISLDNR